MAGARKGRASRLVANRELSLECQRLVTMLSFFDGSRWVSVDVCVMEGDRPLGDCSSEVSLRGRSHSLRLLVVCSVRRRVMEHIHRSVVDIGMIGLLCFDRLRQLILAPSTERPRRRPFPERLPFAGKDGSCFTSGYRCCSCLCCWELDCCRVLVISNSCLFMRLDLG